MALSSDVVFPLRVYGLNSCMCNSYYYLLLMCERAWVLASILFNTRLCGCPELTWI